MHSHTQIHPQRAISGRHRPAPHGMLAALAVLALAGVGALARTLTAQLLSPADAACRPGPTAGGHAAVPPAESAFRHGFQPAGLLRVPQAYAARREPYLGRRL